MLGPTRLFLLMCAALVPASGCPVQAGGEIAGVASVIDGDTIEIHGQRIRLHGIDAPEGGQTCLDAAGRNWRCGQRAALALQDLIGRRTVTCHERDVDRYGRIVGQCLVGDLGINEWLVAQGLALAYRHYSRDYVAAEDQADRPAAACGPARSSRPGSGGAESEQQLRSIADRTGPDRLEALGLPNRSGGKRAA
jgi:endonuclease YncB( thermonuclease family)